MRYRANSFLYTLDSLQSCIQDIRTAPMVTKFTSYI